MALLKVTKGRPVTACLRKASFWARARAEQTVQYLDLHTGVSQLRQVLAIHLRRRVQRCDHDPVMPASISAWVQGAGAAGCDSRAPG